VLKVAGVGCQVVGMQETAPQRVIWVCFFACAPSRLRLMTHSTRSNVVRSYRDLLVWQRSIDLSVSVYSATDRFPKYEIYGLTAQLRRAAVSIPSNIAEGHGRHHLGDYLHHLSIANGSLKELETQLVIASRRQYLNSDLERSLFNSSTEVGRMLSGLTRSLRAMRRRSPNT